MQIAIIIGALALLMGGAYRGVSVILLAPVCALLAAAASFGSDKILPIYSQLFMAKMVVFIQLYFPVFMLGAIFGKLMEMSGAASSLARAMVRRLGERHVILAVVLACAVLTYGGVSLFVVAFAIYPIAAVLFRQADIPKRLIPGAIALGSFTFTMDALPGTPQIQNVIPTAFFGTTIYAAPVLGCCGAAIMLGGGMFYLEWRRRSAQDGYGQGHSNEPDAKAATGAAINPCLALLPLIVVAGINYGCVRWLPFHYGRFFDLASIGLPGEGRVEVAKNAGIWAIEIGLCGGIAAAAIIGWESLATRSGGGLHSAIAGALLATTNTASEYGFGAVIAALPGFATITALVNHSFSDPFVNEAVSVNVLAGVAGSASGGLSIALAALGKSFQQTAAVAGLDPQVLHRVASMASGGMDTLPHNGAVITLFVITGLNHRSSYKDIFAITCIDTVAVFLVIALYHWTGMR